MPNRPTETTIFHDPATGYYGYRVRFQDSDRFHHGLNTCLTFGDAMDTCDPHREYIWEGATDTSDGALLVSRAFKEGSAYWRMEQREVAMAKRSRC